MTLIIKELIIKGVVSGPSNPLSGASMEKESIKIQMDQLKRDVQRECMEKLMRKIDTRSTR